MKDIAPPQNCQHSAAAAAAAAAAKTLQSCPTLCDPTGGSPPGSPVPGILHILFYSSGSQPGTVLLPKGHLAMPGDIFGHHN